MNSAVLAVAFALSAACSPANVAAPFDAGEDVAPNAEGGITSAQACKDSAYAQCSRLQQCSPTAMQLRHGDIATCEKNMAGNCLNAQSAPSSGATPATAEACAGAAASWACNDFIFNQKIPPGCQESNGSLPNGASCSVRQQCQSGFCALPSGGACGKCAAVPPSGASCAETICPQSLTCVSPSMTCATFAFGGGSMQREPALQRGTDVRLGRLPSGGPDRRQRVLVLAQGAISLRGSFATRRAPRA